VKEKFNPTARAAARLGAVQILYSFEATGQEKSAEILLAHYGQTLLDETSHPAPEETLAIRPDLRYLRRLVEGTLSQLEAVDAAMYAALSDRWKPERLNDTVKAILRSGIYEMTELTDTPARVILNEYTDLTRELCDASDVGFVNAVLESLANGRRE
jgi:N utilization substance protein B